MDPLKIKTKHGPEFKIQGEIISYLEHKRWYVKRMAASVYLTGVPDLFVSHKIFGPRFVEVKLPGMKGSKFTPAQLVEFPLICSHGFGVWVLTGATSSEYHKLKEPPNWTRYLKIMRP